jgi:broad specificity phosphatase PhoE
VSDYNILKERKKKSSLYKRFLRAFEANRYSEETVSLAREVKKEFALRVGDANTGLLDKEAERACQVGKVLREKYKDKIPHIVFVSPYKRTKMTFDGLKCGWPELKIVKMVEDERIREQEHGLYLLYNDWRVFHALHPEQGDLYGIEGRYWYRYPQGENVPDVRSRMYSWMNTVVRDFAERRVLVVAHHLSILSVRANLERWSAQQFIDVDENDKPSNCSVTAYCGDPSEGSSGHFKLDYYNRKFYEK